MWKYSRRIAFQAFRNAALQGAGRKKTSLPGSSHGIALTANAFHSNAELAPILNCVALYVRTIRESATFWLQAPRAIKKGKASEEVKYIEKSRE